MTEQKDRPTNPYYWTYTSCPIPEDDYSEESGPDSVYPDWLTGIGLRIHYTKIKERSIR